MAVRDGYIRTNSVHHTVPGAHKNMSMVVLDNLHIAIAGVHKDNEGGHVV